MHPLFKSSKNPQEVSLTIKAAALQIVSLALFLAPSFGFNSDALQTPLNDIAEQVSVIVGSIVSLVSSFGVVYGLVRKIGRG